MNYGFFNTWFCSRLNNIIYLIIYLILGNSKTTEWLQESVLPQLVRWAVESDLDLPKNIYTESLSLIPTEKYYTKYNELKVKYGKELVKVMNFFP